MTYAYYKKKPVNTNKKWLAVSFFVFGFFLLSSAVFPILQFQFSYSQKFNQLQNPLSTRFYNRSGNILGEVSTDLTQLNNWFVADSSSSPKPESQLSSDGISAYRLSIPSQKIQDATVIVGSMDLKKSLIQYPQTALPGQLGNAVIFGHSVLPQFFNPKSYLTIFSTLYRLKQGDEIYVDYDNIKYKYLVEEMYEVKPTDLSILEQRFDGRYLTLITCSPPGTYLRRLVIKAKIVDF
ncbi:MAG: sortase [Candidatus Shapirobacteria bacterium]